MSATYTRLYRNGPYYSYVRDLYEASFPEEERPPFDFLFDLKDNDLYAVIDQGNPIGLVDLAAYEDLVYVFFLAIDPAYQKKGYGTGALKHVCEWFKTKRIYLCIEALDIEAANYEQRVRRLAFYQKCGFAPAGERLVEYGVAYDLLTYGGAPVSILDHFALTKHILGEERAKDYFANASICK
ncbi:MAG: GNAT family N-acetyltransferase [Bacilli bacterium]|nr:GNAT family N-acetyltransferase [Bacilli bacterium]